MTDRENRSGQGRPCHELQRLLDPEGGFRNWVEFVLGHKRVWPCIQVHGQFGAGAEAQVEAFQAAGRPWCLRLHRGHCPDNIGEIVGALTAAGARDFAVILEGGWTRNALLLKKWCNGMLRGPLAPIDASVPVALSCTSLPKTFTGYSNEKPVPEPFRNRRLVEQVQRWSNRVIIYGDWGSTRPHERDEQENEQESRSVPRVDYPTQYAWHIARNRKDEWNFRKAAQAILASPEWRDGLGVWGEEMIRKTTVHEELGIDTLQNNGAARVNIHLYLQAFHGEPLPAPADLYEEWRDDWPDTPD